jgi:very-short-patch-repair endonuclease
VPLWHRDRGPDLFLPEWLRSKHGPPVAVQVSGASHHQEALTWLRYYANDRLPAALYPEPDNPHDSNAVAVIIGGRRVGYLTRDYARLWQPVILAEHAAGRAVTATGRFLDVRAGTGLKVTAIQPPPPLPGEPSGGDPLPRGQGGLEAFWPHRELTRKAIRRHRRARAREFRLDRANRIAGYGAVAMTETEARLYHYLAQMPEPFRFYPQVPFSSLRLDFYCPYAALCVEVDGPEHAQGERWERDRRRTRFLSNRGISTYRVKNKRVDADPVRAAMMVFAAACRRVNAMPPSDPRSPYCGWRPRAPLRPLWVGSGCGGVAAWRRGRMAAWPRGRGGGA